MNGTFFLNVTRGILISAIIGIASILWDMNSKLVTLDERVKNVLARSDKNDVSLERKLNEIEQHLNELRRPK
jgi:hypothetical protein